MIAGVVRLTSEVQDSLDKELLVANGNKRKEGELQLKGEKEVQVSKLSLKHKVEQGCQEARQRPGKGLPRKRAES